MIYKRKKKEKRKKKKIVSPMAGQKISEDAAHATKYNQKQISNEFIGLIGLLVG